MSDETLRMLIAALTPTLAALAALIMSMVNRAKTKADIQHLQSSTNELKKSTDGVVDKLTLATAGKAFAEGQIVGAADMTTSATALLNEARMRAAELLATAELRAKDVLATAKEAKE